VLARDEQDRRRRGDHPMMVCELCLDEVDELLSAWISDGSVFVCRGCLDRNGSSMTKCVGCGAPRIECDEVQPVIQLHGEWLPIFGGDAKNADIHTWLCMRCVETSP